MVTKKTERRKKAKSRVGETQKLTVRIPPIEVQHRIPESHGGPSEGCHLVDDLTILECLDGKGSLIDQLDAARNHMLGRFTDIRSAVILIGIRRGQRLTGDELRTARRRRKP